MIFLSVGLRPDFPFGLIFCLFGAIDVAFVDVVFVFVFDVGGAGGDCC